MSAMPRVQDDDRVISVTTRYPVSLRPTPLQPGIPQTDSRDLQSTFEALLRKFSWIQRQPPGQLSMFDVDAFDRQLTFSDLMEVTQRRQVDRDIVMVHDPGTSFLRSVSPPLLRTESTMINLIERLTELHDLPADWDSYGALPVNDQVEVRARELLVAFWNAGLIPDDPDFDLIPGPDGGLQLEWTGRNGELEIRVSPGDSFSILQILPDGTYRHPEWESQPTVSAMKGLIAEVLG